MSRRERGEDMSVESLHLSVLLTKEEYLDFFVQQQRKRRQEKVSLLPFCGGALAVLGLAGLFFGEQVALAPGLAVCLVLLGLVLLCYDGLLAPILDRSVAAREFEEKDDRRLANTYKISAEAVEVCNSRFEGRLPLSWMTGWMQTASGFCLLFGRDVQIFLPTRLLSDEQTAALRSWLQDAEKATASAGSI